MAQKCCQISTETSQFSFLVHPNLCHWCHPSNDQSLTQNGVAPLCRPNVVWAEPELHVSGFLLMIDLDPPAMDSERIWKYLECAKLVRPPSTSWDQTGRHDPWDRCRSTVTGLRHTWHTPTKNLTPARRALGVTNAIGLSSDTLLRSLHKDWRPATTGVTQFLYYLLCQKRV